MAKKVPDILEFMGRTPSVVLKRIVPTSAARVYVKLEKYNPGGSLKARVALQMVLEAEKKGILRPDSGQTILEPTGGNTGIGLAIVGAIRGYRVILVIPDNYSEEKQKVLRAYGAEVVLSDSTTGNDSHVAKAREILTKNPGFVWLDQLSNTANPMAHYQNTAAEILASISSIDCFVAGIGSGGTITGIGRRIREAFPQARVIAVQPEGCDVLSGRAIQHQIQGFAIGRIPPILDVNIPDSVFSVTFDQARATMIRLAEKEGLLLGISSGANVYAAIAVSQELDPTKTVVTIAPDGGRSYLDLFENDYP